MRKIDGFENVKATDGEFVKPPAGGYCIEILDVQDVPMDARTGKGDYLKIFYDICHGEFAGYYQKQHERFGGDYFTSFIRSYKEKALGMFKHFTNCVEESNVGYKWNWDEKSLIGKYVGVVLQEEEYQKQDGSVGTRMIVKDIKTIDQIGSGDFKVYETKKLDKTISWQAQPDPLMSTPFNDEDLPFN